MGGPELKRSVGDAVGAAESVVRHGRIVEGHMRPPSQSSEAERVHASVSASRESLRSLVAYSHTINPNFSVPQTGPLAGQLSAEAQYRAAARGHEGPARVFTAAEAARAHSREEDSSARALLRQVYPDGRFEDATSSRAPRAAELEGTARDVARWFGPAALGQSVAARFSRTPPIVTGETQQYFRHIGAANGLPGQTVGVQYPNTNHIAVDAEGIYEADRYASEDERRCILAHEMFHYAAMLGGGYDMRWRGPNGEPIIRDRISWLHEGMTELHAQQLTRSRGYAPGSVSYAAETTVSFYLQQLAGAAVVRDAYLSGDLTEVRRLVDLQLGQGAFEGMIATGSGAGAFFYLRGRIERRGMSDRLAEWDRNVIVRTAGVVEEHREAEDARREGEQDPNAIHSGR